MAAVSRPLPLPFPFVREIDVHIFRYRNMCRFNSGVRLSHAMMLLFTADAPPPT